MAKSPSADLKLLDRSWRDLLEREALMPGPSYAHRQYPISSVFLFSVPLYHNEPFDLSSTSVRRLTVRVLDVSHCIWLDLSYLTVTPATMSLTCQPLLLSDGCLPMYMYPVRMVRGCRASPEQYPNCVLPMPVPHSYNDELIYTQGQAAWFFIMLQIDGVGFTYS